MAPGSSGYNARGGQTICRDGYLLLRDVKGETTLLADMTSPCPICDKTAAANMTAWKAILSWMLPPLHERRHVVMPLTVPSKVNRSDADLNEIDTTGFTVVKVPEGVVPRRNADGSGFVHKDGQVVMDTIDFRSDEAVKARLAGGMSKWGKGRVTGSTSVCSTWAVPARPFSDGMANSRQVNDDLRSTNKERIREKQRLQKSPPRKGRHRKPDTEVVRRYLA